MLPAHLQELLTAAVDGELSPAERRLVEKLLRDSEEAREFHGKLQADAERLRNLPTPSRADDFAATVLAIINDRGLAPTPLPTPRRKENRWNSSTALVWGSYAAAAVVLLTVSIGSYLYFAASQQQLASAKKDKEAESILPAPPVVAERSHPAVVKKVPETRTAPIGAEVLPDPLRFLPELIAKGTPRDPELLPMPRSQEIIASPPQPESDPFRQVTIRLPVLLPLRDLDEAYPKKQVRDELKKDEVVHIDLFCKHGPRAVELLQAALRARGQSVIVEAAAQDALKRRPKAEYLFYTESLTAEEIAQLLEHLGAEDKKAEAAKGGAGQFDKFMLAEFNTTDLTELARLLGIPAAQLKLPKVRPVGNLAPTKSLESDTAGRLVAALPKGTAARAGEKVTLLLPYTQPHADPRTSKDIKSFLEKRGERRPGAVPMMLVLRPLN
jgi:negative regulator of sigma E activity